MKIYHRDTETPRMQTPRFPGGILEERKEISINAALLPLYSSSKRGCGNFGHGIPGDEMPATFSFPCPDPSRRVLGVSVSLAVLGGW
jgi:hypothetical protein